MWLGKDEQLERELRGPLPVHFLGYIHVHLSHLQLKVKRHYSPLKTRLCYSGLSKMDALWQLPYCLTFNLARDVGHFGRPPTEGVQTDMVRR